MPMSTNSTQSVHAPDPDWFSHTPFIYQPPPDVAVATSLGEPPPEPRPHQHPTARVAAKVVARYPELHPDYRRPDQPQPYRDAADRTAYEAAALQGFIVAIKIGCALGTIVCIGLTIRAIGLALT